MNSTIQCFKAIPELQEELKVFPTKVKPANSADREHQLVERLGGLVSVMNNSQPAKPVAFWMLLRQLFPQFAQTNKEGFFMQQDAEECWNSILTTIAKKIAPIGSKENPTLTANIVQQLFGGSMTVKMSNTEAKEEQEPSTTTVEKFNKLSCHIGSTTINYLIDGLKSSMEEKVKKNSTVLGKECDYLKVSKLSKLPFYLMVQFVRFDWRSDTKLKAKVVRPVEFPFTFDAYDLCDDDLKTKLAAKRKELDPENKSKQETKPMEVTTENNNQAPPATDPFQNETGYYELFALITHKGRYADSGHYVAWVKEDKPAKKEEEKNDEKPAKKEKREEYWMKFDDDVVSLVTTDEIKKLSGKGGADWHMAYLAFFRTKKDLSP